MPEAPDTEPFSVQLKRALDADDVSQAELARRLAGPDAPRKATERKRRWVQKLLTGDVQRPTPDSIASIEAALTLPPGTLHVPGRPARGRQLDRLLALEARIVARLDDLDCRLEELSKKAERGARANEKTIRHLSAEISRLSEPQEVPERRSPRQGH